MKVVPLSATPSQTFAAVLGGQNCTFRIYQKSTGMFLDLSIDQTKILTGVLCLNLVNIVQQEYLGFVGGLFFMDIQGFDDPQFAGLGNRWVLMYLESSDL